MPESAGLRNETWQIKVAGEAGASDFPAARGRADVAGRL
ncbi:MAG: hypothetical protein JWR19_920 [Pedosphaera sp.]|nr:hypothetical protein [Pedosphaera sp.]